MSEQEYHLVLWEYLTKDTRALMEQCQAFLNGGKQKVERPP